MRAALVLAAAAAALAVLALAATAAAQTNVPGGTLAADTTWSLAGSPYVLLGDVTVIGTSGPDGVTTLTIEPGVEVRGNSNADLIVGGLVASSPGALDARGTEVQPILFTSNQVSKTRGFWSGVTFRNFASDTLSFLENATIEYAGGTGNLYLDQSAPTVRSVTLRESSTYGVQVNIGSPVIEAATIQSNTQHGALVTGSSTPTFRGTTFASNGQYGLFTNSGVPNLESPVFQSNVQRPLRMHVQSLLLTPTFQGNAIQEVDLITNPSFLTMDRTLAALADAGTSAALPYNVTGGITVRGTDGADGVTTLTVAPGVEMRFQSATWLDVGTTTASAPGALVAQGTALEPIVLTSAQTAKTKGFWYGVQFLNFARDDLTVLENVTVEYAGVGNYGVNFNAAKPSGGFRNSVVRHNSGHGVHVATDSVDVHNVTVLNSTLHGFNVASGGLNLSQSVASANGQHGVYVNGAVSLVGVQLLNNGQYGLFTANGQPSLAGVGVQGSGQRPLRIHPNSAFQDTALSGNAIREIELIAGNVDKDQPWPLLLDGVSGLPHAYIVLGATTVRGQAGPDLVSTLTLAPGVELRFASAAYLDVGHTTAATAGALDARGTAVQPILLTSNQVAKTKGFYYGLYFYNFASDALSFVENVTIEYGGFGGYGLYLNAAHPTVRNVAVLNTGGHGIQVTTDAVLLENVTVTGSTGSGVYMNSGSLALVDSLLGSNGVHGLYVNGPATLTNAQLAGNAQYGLFTNSGVPHLAGSAVSGSGQRPLRISAASVFQDTVLDANAVKEVELLGATLTADQHWPIMADATTSQAHAYVLLGDTTVQGTAGPDGTTSLTLAPRLELRMAQNVDLTIGGGSAGQNGALVAEGTASEPILITSTQTVKTKGWWGTLTFNNFASDTLTVLANLTVEYGGQSSGAFLFSNSAPTLADSVVRHHNNHGVHVLGGAPRLRNVTILDVQTHGLNLASGSATVEGGAITNAGQHGVAVNGALTMAGTAIAGSGQYGVHTTSGVPMLSGSSVSGSGQRPLRIHPGSAFQDTLLSGNAIPEIEFTGGTIALDQPWPALFDAATSARHVYVVLGDVFVQGTDGPDATTTLTLQPGQELRMGQNVDLDIGGSSAATAGALVAAGTEAEPILFTSTQAVKTRGWWAHIVFNNFASDALSRLENLTLEYAGQSTGALYLNSAQPVVRNVTVRHQNNHGVYVTGASAVLERLAVQDTQLTGVYVAGGGLTLLDATIQDSGNHGLYLGVGATLANVAITNSTQYGIHAVAGTATLSGVSVAQSGQRPLRLGAGSLFEGTAVSQSGILEVEFVGGTVAQDRTWPLLLDGASLLPHAYVLLGDVLVQGADGPDGVTTLTLAPGTTLRMGQFADIAVGGSSAGSFGALDARGTEAQPILLTSNQVSKTKGWWGPLAFHNFASDALSRLENLTLEFGGQATAGLHLNSAQPGLRNVTVQDVSNHGVYITGATPRMEGGTVQRAAQNGVHVNTGGVELVGVELRDGGARPLRMSPDSQLLGLTLRNHTIQEVEVFAGTAARDATWPVLADADTAQPVPYVLAGAVTVQGSDGPDALTTLTLPPGLLVKANAGASLNVGGFGAGQVGALVAQGTAAQPVVLTSNQVAKTRGFWSGLDFNFGALDNASRLENVTIEYANIGVYSNQCDILVANSLVREHSAQGIYLQNSQWTRVEGTMVQGVGTHAIYGTGLGGGAVLQGNTVLDAPQGIHVASGSDYLVVGNAVSNTSTYTAYLAGDRAVVRGNTFQSQDGIFELPSGADQNLVVDNVFARASGAKPARDSGAGNRWNLTPEAGPNVLGGPLRGGNAYNDYAGIDWTNPSDGLGDTLVPYVLNGTASAKDLHPLVGPSAWVPDVIPPVSDLTITGTLAPSGWYQTAVDLNITATDGDSGVKAIITALDGGPSQTYTGTVVLALDGLHQFTWYATDHAGNAEALRNATIPLDRNAPLIAIDIDESVIDDLCWWLNVTETGSGLAALNWSLVDQDEVPAVNATNTTLQAIPGQSGVPTCAGLGGDAKVRLRAAAQDHAGLASTKQTGLMALDIVGPVLDLVRPKAGGAYLGTTTLYAPPAGAAGAATVVVQVQVLAHASDAGSGVVLGELLVDGVLVDTDAHAPFVWTVGPGLEPGLHTLEVRAHDGVGHVSSASVDFVLVAVPDAAALAAPCSEDAGRAPAEACREALAAAAPAPRRPQPGPR